MDMRRGGKKNAEYATPGKFNIRPMASSEKNFTEEDEDDEHVYKKKKKLRVSDEDSGGDPFNPKHKYERLKGRPRGNKKKTKSAFPEFEEQMMIRQAKRQQEKRIESPLAKSPLEIDSDNSLDMPKDKGSQKKRKNKKDKKDKKNKKKK